MRRSTLRSNDGGQDARTPTFLRNHRHSQINTDFYYDFICEKTKRNGFIINSTTNLRDGYYTKNFGILARYAKSNGNLAGANFWTLGGAARPFTNQPFWKKGDDYTGDPPMEEQGLNSVFDGDKTTWAVINKYSKLLERRR